MVHPGQLNLRQTPALLAGMGWCAVRRYNPRFFGRADIELGVDELQVLDHGAAALPMAVCHVTQHTGKLNQTFLCVASKDNLAQPVSFEYT
eukprot:2234016-Amphidinium_carterae.1